MKKIAPLLLICLVLTLVGCDTEPGAPEFEPFAFVPLEEGNEWHYTRTLPQGEDPDGFTVTMGMVSRGGRSLFGTTSILDVPNELTDRGAYDDHTFEYVSDGLRVIDWSEGEVARDYLFRHPGAGSTFYEHPGYAQRPEWSFSANLISGDSTIVTPAGTFDCVVYRTVWTADGTIQQRTEEYFAEGVGIVRRKVQVLSYQINQWDLDSYAVGSNPVGP